MLFNSLGKGRGGEGGQVTEEWGGGGGGLLPDSW